MTIDVSSLQQFTDADLLVIYRNALATGAFRQEYRTTDGRTLRVPDQAACMKMITWLEQRIQDDANTAGGGNTSFVQFDPPM